jgi:hypothetical protein
MRSSSNNVKLWWKGIIGVYKGDTEFDEAEKLGKEYRQSSLPKVDVYEEIYDSDHLMTSKICMRCRHIQSVVRRECVAFPKGIPLKIWTGKSLHREPYPGDNGIQFEARQFKDSSVS